MRAVLRTAILYILDTLLPVLRTYGIGLPVCTTVLDKSTFGKRHHGTAVRQYSCMRTAVQPALLRVLGYKLSRRMSARIA
jgi:hypothetical protein